MYCPISLHGEHWFVVRFKLSAGLHIKHPLFVGSKHLEQELSHDEEDTHRLMGDASWVSDAAQVKQQIGILHRQVLQLGWHGFLSTYITWSKLLIPVITTSIPFTGSINENLRDPYAVSE